MNRGKGKKGKKRKTKNNKKKRVNGGKVLWELEEEEEQEIKILENQGAPLPLSSPAQNRRNDIL